MANPTGGQVVAGDASITSQGKSLDINQNSHKAIIDWRSFNISQGEQTNFKQPSASALTLNRVGGGQLSQINGQLNANGQVFLINPQGVIFGSNAQVTTGGLVATTSDIRNDDFIAGNYQFDQASPNPNASITNQGHISTNDGGAIVLAAPTVNNEGTVQARLGSVNLASANTFTLDFHGDGLLSFEVQGQITQKPDSVSDDAALVNNSGTIIADGGTVTLTAQAADAVIDRVINMDGIIQATTLGEDKGKIILSGGDHGIVDVSGTLDVSGTENNETGGVVHVLGEKVGLFDGTQIYAEGYAGGGEVLVGGNFQGKGLEPNAKRTYVAKNTKINASATKTGDGGKVIVWADETTQYYGDISARGGGQSGDGGFVEVSGKQNLGFNGTVAVDSIQGQAGTVLLDPRDIVIEATTESNDEESGINNRQSILFNDSFSSLDLTISTTALEALMGVIRLQANRIITIISDLDLQRLTKPNSHKIIFQAGEGINVNANMITSGGDVHLETSLKGSSSPRRIFVKGGKSIKTNGGNITLIANLIDLENHPTDPTKDSLIDAGSGQINIARISGVADSEIELIAKDIKISPNSNLFFAANDFKQLKTTGDLVFGRATLGGMYPADSTLNGDDLSGIDQVILATTMSINTATTFISGQVTLEAKFIIQIAEAIQGLGQASIKLKASTISLFNSISTEGKPLVLEGNISILDDRILDTTNNGNSDDGADITLIGTVTGQEIIFNEMPTNVPRDLTLNAGNNGQINGSKLMSINNLLIPQSQSTTFSDTIDVSNSLAISANSGITGIGAITVGGTAVFNAGNGGIALDNPNNDFIGTVSLNNQGANNISITDANTLTLSKSTLVTGDLTITGSEIAQTGEIIQAANAGAVTINAGNSTIDLTDVNNNFTGLLMLNNTGNNNVNVTNKASLTLGESNVGNGELNFTGTQITQTGAITQEPSAATSSFTASTGAIDLTQNNDFTSTVSLNTTGANDISIVDINTLDLGASTIGTGNFTVTAGDLNVVGTVSNADGSLTLQPFAFDQNVSINSALGSFSLSSTDFSNLQDGFSTITIGRTDLTGAVTIDNASFTDPLIVEAAGAGASITVNGVLTGDDNASITLNGSGETTFLNGNIITAGNPITINDAVILGNSVLLDTTAGGGSQGAGITVSGSVNGSTPLTVTAGAGAINLTNQANNITGSLIVNNNGNNNVNVTNNALLTLGTSNVGNGQLNITGTQISQTGAITQEAGAAATSFSATTGAIDLTQNNDFTSTVSLNNIGANDINIVDINTLNLGASSIGSGNFTVTAGDLNIVGSVLNAGGSLTLQPFDLSQNMSINDSSGSFNLLSNEISNLQNGFSTITLGRPGLTGNVTIDNASFTDPLIVQADGTGGSITVNGVLAGTDDASITLNGSGNTTFLNGNIVTTGNSIIINDAIILGNTVLLDTTSGGAFTGAGITLNGTVNRGAALTPLTLSAGANTGDILFTGDVGVNTQLGDVTVLSANNITMTGRFLANDTRLTFSGLWQNNSNLPLDVNSLFVTPLAQGATVFGRVNSRGGLFAALEVTGVSNDLRYTINGCVMGIFCGITGVPDTNIPDLPPADTDLLPVAKLELMNIWEQQKRLQDPRDERYSNLGNEELWWER